MLGRMVYARSIDVNETQLDLRPNLAAGLYFVRLHGPGRAVSVKVILRN